MNFYVTINTIDHECCYNIPNYQYGHGDYQCVTNGLLDTDREKLSNGLNTTHPWCLYFI